MPNRAPIVLILAALLLTLACSSNGDSSSTGGSCVYDSIPGVATVTGIDTADASDGTLCSGAGFVVSYSFAPDDSSITEADYSLLNYAMRLTIPDGSETLPSQECLDETGVAVGATFKVVREIIAAGTCTPVIDAWTVHPLLNCVGLCG